MRKQQRVPRRVFWPLMIAGGVAVGGAYVAARVIAVAERLTEERAEAVPVTDLTGRTSDFSAMEED
jgi:hypothetical protein